jgi:hypothetical protein
VSSSPETRRFTAAEYLRLAEVGILRPEERVELIDGVIVAMSPLVEVHREPSASGYKLIRRLTAGDTLLPLALEEVGARPLPAADFLPR